MKPTGLASRGIASVAGRYTRAMITVGKLLGWLFVPILILGICGLGYVAFTYQQARAYGGKKTSGTTVGDILALYKDAPSLICAHSGTGFSSAYSEKLYASNGVVRIDVSNASDNVLVHEIINDSGMYVWTDGSLEVVLLPAETDISKGAEGTNDLISDDSCEPWWNPDTSLLRVPEAAIVHEMQ